jgi:hypothetical protein
VANQRVDVYARLELGFNSANEPIEATKAVELLRVAQFRGVE